MDAETALLVATAAGIALLHTLAGPDHYLPFIMMSRARQWPLRLSLLVTFLCGLGHVLSSVVLGAVGVAIGVAVSRLEGIEGTRGEIAAWMLIGFGILYGAWGIRHARRGRTHAHAHLHEASEPHAHTHTHVSEHAHMHAAPNERKSITPWVLFVIFVLGPCEPLIPLLMYPAARQNVLALVLVTLVFAVVTIATMATIVVAGAAGLRTLRLGFLERYMHAIAGGTIALSGLAIQFLGL